MRAAVLIVALLFGAALSALTVSDVVRNGLTVLDVVSALIIVIFMVGTVGALRHPPRE